MTKQGTGEAPRPREARERPTRDSASEGQSCCQRVFIPGLHEALRGIGERIERRSNAQAIHSRLCSVESEAEAAYTRRPWASCDWLDGHRDLRVLQRSKQVSTMCRFGGSAFRRLTLFGTTELEKILGSASGSVDTAKEQQVAYDSIELLSALEL